MKTLAFIGEIFQSLVGHELFRSLVSIYPEGQTGSVGYVFESMLPLDDPRTTAIVSLLKSNGYRKKPHDYFSEDESGYYNYALHRAYSDEELLRYDLLELRPPSGAFNGAKRGKDGELLIPEGLLPSPAGLDEWDFLSGYARHTWIFVPPRVKVILDSAHLSQLLIHPARFWPQNMALSDWPTVQQMTGIRFWEIDTDITLPPVSSSVELRDEFGNTVRPGEGRVGVHIREGDYAYPQLHYNAPEINALPRFDIARTYENFFPVPTREYRKDFSTIIVSRRFFEVCRANRLKADWIPVIIDPMSSLTIDNSVP